MSLLQAFHQALHHWLFPHHLDDEVAFRQTVRSAVHDVKNVAARSVAESHISKKVSDRVTVAAHQAIRRMEEARENKKCDD